MDRQPIVTRISDPSLPIGRRKEIDNVMKKARANSNDYWDKKLLEVEEKDPNRWRHTGYKKMYIEGESRGSNNRNRSSRSRSRTRKSPPLSPVSKRSQNDQRGSRRSPDTKRSSNDVRRHSARSPEVRRRPRSPPPEPPSDAIYNRTNNSNERSQKRILPRSKRPPSPPAISRSPSNSSVSCTDDSCSVCSPKPKRVRSRSTSRSRHRAPVRSTSNSRLIHSGSKIDGRTSISSGHHSKQRPPSPVFRSEKLLRDRVFTSRAQPIDEHSHDQLLSKHSLSSRLSKTARVSLDYLRVKNPAEPSESSLSKKKSKDKTIDKLRARVKIEGEKYKQNKEIEIEKESSDSDDSSSSGENSFPTFAATTRLTLSERFGKMAQWSIDRSNMENMRITKDSTGGALKVMIEEGLEPQRRYNYSPAPQGHFPEELATTAPTGLMSWDDVRVRYEYYKSRGYLRDLDLKDYVKWEEWWYRYQEWLKQERYYEFYERQQMNRRRRKKVPITQRLN
ncbi:uncharacterized protein DDB_G0287625 isoform X2 [Contarinia nasturtii]|nr:uncharacterized protein DDB_G0287625 isoform X2 [Contarinia nasturtii]